MSLETIVFTVAGAPLAFSECTLSASAEEAVRNATFEIAYNGPGLPCRIDDEATIHVSGELWGTGYVRDVHGEHYDGERGYTVTFVSRTCDATECSIVHPTGLAENVDLADIAEEFDMLGIGIEADADTGVKAIHKVIPGETLFATLEADARAQGVLIYDTPEGRLKLADKPEGRHAGTLKRGVNIVEASGDLSGAENFSEVRVRGQASVGTDASALRPEAVAPGVARRARPLLKLLEGEATTDRLKRRAEWEARRGNGKGIACTITMAGMRDAAGMIWSPNRLIEVDDDWIGVQQDMVVASVSLQQDGEDGTTTVLTLKDPRALGGDNPHGKSDGGWGAPAPVDVPVSAR